ncbi:hypothetical protein CYMTET_37613 [Cymbomonas tetramitiformis]|uniref:Uncharacterized protein n=1 Tax=Cymbomonas tetramitiformis TaxID=36881 RepID=A0AAE0BWY9_9CHLO|nr:hypothetical protein CYMTET_46051 [Cymbomonas tetramitiformis]KAK3253130.1 hypothetical protein CYMTET_37613 [Cymbomonas tetramitiformis]
MDMCVHACIVLCRAHPAIQPLAARSMDALHRWSRQPYISTGACFVTTRLVAKEFLRVHNDRVLSDVRALVAHAKAIQELTAATEPTPQLALGMHARSVRRLQAFCAAHDAVATPSLRRSALFVCELRALGALGGFDPAYENALGVAATLNMNREVAVCTPDCIELYRQGARAAAPRDIHVALARNLELHPLSKPAERIQEKLRTRYKRVGLAHIAPIVTAYLLICDEDTRDVALLLPESLADAKEPSG